MTQVIRAYTWTSRSLFGALCLCLLVLGCSSGTIHTNSPADGLDAGATSDGGSSTDADGHQGADEGLPDAANDAGVDGSAGDDGGGAGFSCDDPLPEWLLCEDFEDGQGNFDNWLSSSDFISGSGQDDRGRIALTSTNVHSGHWAVHMPAASGSGYQGASLDWRACDGEQRSNCSMLSYEQLYFRAWIRFAPDHRYVHHFLNIGGSQPDDYWYHGTAGCLPNGELSMGTTVDFHENTHESHFYTYYPDMGCSTNCHTYMDVEALCQDCLDKGLPTCTAQNQCCWGDHFEPDPPIALPVGSWFCFEMMMKANTIGLQDGEMAYWIDGTLAHMVDENNNGPIWWRTSPSLALNRVRLQHYITTEDAESHSNQVWFDDVVVSTARIGCD